MKKFAIAILLLLLILHQGKAQNQSFNLEGSKSGQLKSLSILENKGTTHFQNAIKSRELVLNPMLQQNRLLHVNDTIHLDLFDNKGYTATIDKLETDVNGTSTIRARLVDYDFGYCVISTYQGKSFITIEIPEKNELYLTKYNREVNKYFLLQIDKTKQKALEGSAPIVPQKNDGFHFKENSSRDLPDQRLQKNTNNTGDILLKKASIAGNENDTITVMIVYTPAAALWAKTNETDINNSINLLMAKSQLVLDNSQTFTTLKLVYSAQVNYSELNSMDVM